MEDIDISTEVEDYDLKGRKILARLKWKNI